MRAGCEVVMPQMGDSIEEGVITKWLVEVGSRVERDQPLLEISTDKVDAEIPSPASGYLTQILYPAGATVPVNIPVAWIGPDRPESLGGASLTGLEEPVLDGAPQIRPGELHVAVDPQPSASTRNRGLWSVLIALFAARLLWHLYDWLQGDGAPYRALLPAAALLFSAAQLLGETKKGPAYKLVLLASVILAVAFVVSFALVP